MPARDWCPENDLVWQKEQAELYKDSLAEKYAALRARLAEVEAQRDGLKDLVRVLISRIEDYTDRSQPALREAFAKLEDK